MSMTGHDTPAIYFKTLLFLAMFPGIYNYLKVFFPHENIYPINRGEGNKIEFIVVMKFIFSAHKLKIQFPYYYAQV
jgi:hypothetical protein